MQENRLTYLAHLDTIDQAIFNQFYSRCEASRVLMHVEEKVRLLFRKIKEIRLCYSLNLSERKEEEYKKKLEYLLLKEGNCYEYFDMALRLVNTIMILFQSHIEHKDPDITIPENWDSIMPSSLGEKRKKIMRVN